jgi:hypothetical protein
MKLFLVFSIAFVATETAQAQCTPCFEGDTPEQNVQCDATAADATNLEEGTTACEFNQLTAYQLECCDKTPLGLCTICPDGSTGWNPDQAVPNPRPGRDDITCADLNGDGDFMEFVFEAGQCNDTLLQRSATWCGCPGTTRECNLCNDGSTPTKLNRVEKVIYGWDCGKYYKGLYYFQSGVILTSLVIALYEDFFDFVSSFFTEDECPKLGTGEIINIDAAAFCGCPDTNPPGVCNLCPSGQIVRNDLDLGDFSCGELDLSTRYISNIDTCIGAKTRYRLEGNDYINKCCFDLLASTAFAPTVGFPALAFILCSLLSW